MDYRDFVLQITEASEDCLRLQVVESPIGESGEVFCGPESELLRLIDEGREGLGHADPTDAPPGWDSPEALGQRLFDALFTGSVQQRLLEALGQISASEHCGLRLQIRASINSPRVAAAHALPWEYLYRADLGSFMALDRRFAIVRNLCLPHPRRPLAPSATPHLLIAIASPKGLDPLETEAECQNIAEHWSDGVRLKVDILTRTTLESLRERLLARSYHGLHLIGHGCFDELTGDGELFLEDRDGLQAPCSGQDLAIQLADRTSLRWIFLNACSTGCSGTLRPFGGVANALLRTGVSAVVAMQRPISDRSAVVFSSWFYQRLASGDSIEAACTEGRLAVHRDRPQESDWGTPVLFLRGVDGRLLERSPTHETPESSLPEPLVEPQNTLGVKEDLKPMSWGSMILRSMIATICVVAFAHLFGIEWSVGTSPPSLPTTQDNAIQGSDENLVDSGSRPSETLRVRHGKTIRLPSLNAHLSVSFNDILGETVVRARLAVQGEPEPVQKTLMGPGTIDLGLNGRVRIQAIDWQLQEVTILVDR